MSNLKAASYYLQQIVDYMKEKTIEFKSFGYYLEEVKKNDAEVFNFLEKIIMSRHRYQLARQKFIDNANTQIKFNENLKIAFIVLNAVLGVLVILGTLLGSNLLKKNSETSALGRIKIILGVLIALVVLTMGFFISIVHTNDRKADYEGVKNTQYAGEAFFDRFEQKNAVAMYYALKNHFGEPNGPDKEDIKKMFDDLVTPGNVRPAKNMTPQELRNKPEWPQIVDACRPDYLQKTVSSPNRETIPEGLMTQIELEALAKEESYLRMRDNSAMLQEIRTKSIAMLAMVTKLKDDQTSDVLANEDINEVVKKEIVPFFVQRDIIVLQDVKVKDASKFSLIPLETITAQNQEEVLVYMQRKTECNMVIFNLEERAAAAFTEKTPPINIVLQYSKGSCIYLLNIPDTRTVYLEAGPLTNTPKEPITDIKSTPEKCFEDCSNDPTCVYLKPSASECKLGISMQRPPFASVSRVCSNTATSTCELITYKYDVREIGEKIDRLDYINSVMATIKQKILDISAKYNYQYMWTKYIDVIRGELAVVYQNNEIDLAMVKVTETLESVEEEAKKATQAVTTKFISFDRFVSKLDDMTMGDLLYYRQNVVKKMYDTIYILHEKIQNGLVNQGSIEKNMFLEKERSLYGQKIIIWSCAGLLGLGYLYYVVSIFDSSSERSVGETTVKLVTPLVIIGVLLTVMFAYNIKQTSIFSYNRDILESNDTKLLDSIFMVLLSVDAMNKQLGGNSVKAKIKDLNINETTKRAMYTNTVNAINMLERCNLITDASEVLLPFPYIDITINAIAVLVSFSAMSYMIKNMSPLENILQIQMINKITKLVQDHPGKFSLSDFPELECLSSGDGSAIKIIGVFVLMMIAIMYSTKVMRSSSEYIQGLYNSRYFVESRCVK